MSYRDACLWYRTVHHIGILAEYEAAEGRQPSRTFPMKCDRLACNHVATITCMGVLPAPDPTWPLSENYTTMNQG